jgi:hypothetical protein
VVSRTWEGGINPVTVDFSYNADSGVTQIVRFNGLSSSQPVLTSNLGYDADGNSTTLTTTDGSGNTLESEK